MAKTKRELLIASFVLTGIAVTLQLVALGTEQWIVSEARISGDHSEQPSEIRYGLFSGILKLNIGGSSTTYDLTLTCLISENVCAYICGYSADIRESTLKKLYYEEGTQFDTSCTSVPKSYNNFYVQNYFPSVRSGTSADFINSGIYISTVIFLIISAGFGFVSALLTLWNSTTNPINPYLSIFGIHIYNGVAVIATLITLALWGALFGETLVKNVSMEITLSGEMTSDGLANLGFSYWIILPTLFLYITSDLLLYTRNILINREPRQITMDEIQDPGLILF